MSFSYDRLTFRTDCNLIFNRLKKVLHPVHDLWLELFANASEPAEHDLGDSPPARRGAWVDMYDHHFGATVKVPLFNTLGEFRDREEARQYLARVVLHEFSHIIMADTLACIKEISEPAYKLVHEKMAGATDLCIRRVLGDATMCALLQGEPLPKSKKRRRK